MGTSGVRWTETDENVIKVIIESKGRVSHAAKKLGVTAMTLYTRINTVPAVKEALDEARKEFDTTLLDAAEDTLLYAISKRDQDMGSALKSVFYSLNNKGGDRGYSHANKGNYTDEDKKMFQDLMKQMSSFQGDD